MGELDFLILGPLEVRQDGEPVRIGGRGQRELLALLVLHANEVVSTDRLLDALWPDQRPSSGRTALQNRISHLRKTFGSRAAIETQPSGYSLRVDPQRVDLVRFQRLAQRARAELGSGDPEGAATTARAALDHWRGEPLADLGTEVFRAERLRLEELRLAAFALCIDAELACGRHEELIGELRGLIDEHPLHEGFREQLMLSLYRSGRQAESLDVYREGRDVLVDELGIEPGPDLQRVHKAILSQDPALESNARGRVARRSILAVGRDARELENLLSIGEILARSPAPPELIAVALLPPSSREAVTETNRLLQERRHSLSEGGMTLRAAALTSANPASEVVRLAGVYDVDLILLAATNRALVGDDRRELDVVLRDAPPDVALVPSQGPEMEAGTNRPVTVPFGGGENDWAALEIGAWIARALGVTLELVGVGGDPSADRRDASRLLASASLAVQGFLGISVDSTLAGRGPQGLVRATAHSALSVIGLPTQWRERGLGEPRRALLEATAPVVFVRRGVRPGGLAPEETFTRFTWSLDADR